MPEVKNGNLTVNLKIWDKDGAPALYPTPTDGTEPEGGFLLDRIHDALVVAGLKSSGITGIRIDGQLAAVMVADSGHGRAPGIDLIVNRDDETATLKGEFSLSEDAEGRPQDIRTVLREISGISLKALEQIKSISLSVPGERYMERVTDRSIFGPNIPKVKTLEEAK